MLHVFTSGDNAAPSLHDVHADHAAGFGALPADERTLAEAEYSDWLDRANADLAAAEVDALFVAEMERRDAGAIPVLRPIAAAPVRLDPAAWGIPAA
jgi:hypothetical protein